jgi:hypothetical protein
MAPNRGIGVSFTDRLRKIENDLDDVRTLFLEKLATEVVTASPVDTGTYVMSHNVGEVSAAGQFTGNIKYIGPPNQNKQAMQQAALNKVLGQIASLPDNQTRVSLSNNSAHANIVEFGGNMWKTKNGYYIYDTARNRAPILLKDAIQEVKARQ